MSLFRRQPPSDPTPPPSPASERPTQPPTIPPTQPIREQATVPPVANPIGFETVLGAHTMFTGTFTSQANVRIDGTFSGKIDIDGNALIGETAKIEADITAKNISIAGAVRGNVTGKKVQILRTGRVWGDITSTALSTEEGAFIDGKISMVTKDGASATQETRVVNLPAEAPAAPVIEAAAPEQAEPDFLGNVEPDTDPDKA
jgi:cytoskeletal protein CcmA (bactofilin family)